MSGRLSQRVTKNEYFGKAKEKAVLTKRSNGNCTMALLLRRQHLMDLQ